MKLLLLFLILYPLSLFAQPDGWEREYFKDESHYVICKKKNKVGLYSNARGVFTIEPHKGYIIHLEEPRLLLDVYPKEEKVDVYHYYDKVVQQLETPYDTGNFWLGHILASQWDKKLKATSFEKEMDGEMHEAVLITTEDSNLENEDNYRPDSRLNYYFEGDHLRLNFYHGNTYDNTIFAMQSWAYPGEDSIDFQGNVVYHPRDEKYILNSGYFNLKTGKWDIPPIYQNTNSWEGIIGCYYWPSERGDDELQDDGIVYSFFKKEKKEIVPTPYQKYQGFAFPLDLWLFEDEKVWYDYDSIYVYHQNKKGVGMYKIPLSGKYALDINYTLNWLATEGRFEVEELLKPQYRFVIRSGNMDYFQSPAYNKWHYTLASKGNNTFDVLSTYEDWETESPDTLFQDITINSSIKLNYAELWTDETTSIREAVIVVDDTILLRPVPKTTEDIVTYRLYDPISDEWCPPTIYKTEVLDDGQLIVNSNMPECGSGEIGLLTHDGYDSLDADGNLVYYPPEPGLYASGVFNTTSNQWIIPPFNSRILYANGGYLIERPVLNKYRNLDSLVYDFMKADGTYEFKNRSKDELLKDKNRKYLIPGGKVEEVQNIDPNSDEFVYFQRDGKNGVAQISLMNSTVMAEPADFVKYSPRESASVVLDEGKAIITAYNMIDLPFADPVIELPLVAGTTVQLNRPVVRNEYMSEVDEHKNQQGILFEVKVADSSQSTIYRCIAHRFENTDIIHTLSRDSVTSTEPIQLSFLDIVSEKEERTEFKYAVLNKELLYFKDNKLEYDALYPVMSLLWYEDSIDADGNVVYYPPDPGYYQSGVYNYKTKQWVIKPEYVAVEWLSGDNFLLNQPETDSAGLLLAHVFLLKQGNQTKELGKTVLDNEQKLKFSCGKINDSLIFINKHIAEDPGAPFIDMFGMDSLDLEGNLVSSEKTAGEYKSGVYNVLNNEWFVENEAQWVHLFDEVFIIQKPVLSADQMVESYTYSVYNKSGDLIKKEVAFEELDAKYRSLME
ncbi:MAG: hypothetical protein WDZ35_10010 [Crocinitomicaceae bacterium]